ncbi:FtsX-like permease family protein [Altererythrobacter sp. CC-YST694]|uniref:ABC transporter permease n=1 Tax=Altererythrobacter sp. CC-YST694 TaxID=2755038 RepID=UPI001D01DD94|nr:FtsX-like permease family protein [Altererythrobacter sp. CC-YST694]MCB5425954.1 FtsX-like permease family protein [Altererythrobacter sp. CC-YST694]
MTALDLKLVRSLWHMRGQALAIAVVLAAAAATFVLSLGVHHSLTATRDAYYARYHFADIFADMTRAPRSVVERVRAIPGVAAAQGTIQQYATLDFPDRPAPVRVLINSVDERGRDRLNLVVMRSGHMPRRGQAGEVVIDEAFAKANELGIGSRLDAEIYGRRQRLSVVGIGLAPNFIYALAPGEIIPDDRRFGVLWMGEQALQAATDRTGAINSLSLMLAHGASEAEVIRRVDAVLVPFGGTGAYGRKDHLSHAFLDNELTQLNAMTRVIPPVFLLVAALLVYVVLGRMIRTERTQIGLLKAFGYTDRTIAAHYLKFALVIALAGAMLGSLAGILMGRSMTALYAQYYRFPFLEYRIAPAVLLGAAGLAFGSAALGALGGMRSVARLAPAVAMAPPPPPAYRAGLAEKLGRAAGLSAIGHMILRHIARWPGRSAVTAGGIALSMGLLFATLQFLDSSRTMLDSFFFRSQRQDLTVTFTEPRNTAAVRALAQIPGVLRVEPLRAVPVILRNGTHSRRTAIESVSPEARLTARIDSDGSEIAVPPGGVMLSRQLADKLALRAGEPVEVEQLGGRHIRMALPVSRVVDEFIGERAYANTATLMRLTREDTPAGAALMRIDPAAKERILRQLKGMPVVLGVSERDAALAKFEAMIDDNIYTMLGFYIAFSSAIAVGVVYNSARILFSERAHELATLRVLGYHRAEVGIVLLGELALLVAAAIPLGCIVGYWLAQLMTAMFSSDLFRLPFAPAPASYGWSAVIVIIATLGTAATVARRVLHLDMVRVLKAHE